MADARHSVHEMLQHASIPTLIMCLAQITEDDRPSEIAAAVTFLASELASGITGIDLPVDLGYLVATPWLSYGDLRRGPARAVADRAAPRSPPRPPKNTHVADRNGYLGTHLQAGRARCAGDYQQPVRAERAYTQDLRPRAGTIPQPPPKPGCTRNRAVRGWRALQRRRKRCAHAGTTQQAPAHAG